MGSGHARRKKGGLGGRSQWKARRGGGKAGREGSQQEEKGGRRQPTAPVIYQFLFIYL